MPPKFFFPADRAQAARAGVPESVAAAGGATPYVPTPQVHLEANDNTRTEIVKIIIAWLVKQGFTSTAQLLREEATAQLWEGHSQRKVMRALCRSIEDKDWESAHKNLKKLQNGVPGKPQGYFQTETASDLTTLARALPFLLVQQQFLELIDTDDSQRAFAFFMRSIKPMEKFVSREHYQKLSYLLTCKTVAESAALYPEFRGWTPEIGRSQLLRSVTNIAGDCVFEPYCRQGNISDFGISTADSPPTQPGTSPHSLQSLDVIIAQSLSYDLLMRDHPSLARGRPLIVSRTLMPAPAHEVTLGEPVLRIDVSEAITRFLASWGNAGKNGASAAARPHETSEVASALLSHRPLLLAACQPFFAAPAVAVANQTGTVFWFPLEERQPRQSPTVSSASSGAAADSSCYSAASSSGSPILMRHKYAVKGMGRHESKLLVWGGPQAIVLDVSGRVPTAKHEKEVNPTTYAADGLPGGASSLLAAQQAFSDGSVSPGASSQMGAAADAGRQSPSLPAENKEVTHVFTHNADVMSSCFFPCGTAVAAGLSDGTVTVWDTVNGAKMFENTFGHSPVVSILVNRSGTTYFAATKDGTIRAVDVATGVVLGILSSTVAAELTGIALSPSSTLLLAAYRGGAIRLWDVLLGRRLQYHFLGAEKSTKTSYPVSFGDRDTRLLAGGSDGCLYTWSLQSTGTGMSVQQQHQQHLISRQTSANAMATPSTSSIFDNLRAPVGSIMGVEKRLLASPVNSYGSAHTLTQSRVVHPVSQAPLHRANVSDVKVESGYIVTCGEDGVVNICQCGAV